LRPWPWMAVAATVVCLAALGAAAMVSADHPTVPEGATAPIEPQPVTVPGPPTATAPAAKARVDPRPTDPTGTAVQVRPAHRNTAASVSRGSAGAERVRDGAPPKKQKGHGGKNGKGETKGKGKK
jgi:hypothetical protein